MPWSNQTGNGGWKSGGGGNPGGPWGQRPQNPRPGPGGPSPDLEDILRRGQDRLRRVMPGGGGGGSTGGGLALAGLAAAGIAVVWLFNAVFIVEPDEVGVELLFGQPSEEVLEPGLHFIFWPVQTVETVPAVENQLPIGRNQQGASTGLMLSGDQNLVDVQFSVLYQVYDPQAFLFNVDDPQGMLRQVSESAMREVVGRSRVEALFRNDRVGIAEDVRAITQATLDSYGAGLRVNAIAIEDTAPPTEVASAFDEVQRARQDQTRFVNEAQQYQNQRLGQARSEAVQIREDAAAYKNRVVQEATGESQRFTSILTEYERAPGVTRQRLYLETMQAVLGDSNMVIVDERAAGGQGVVPYLPLTEVERQGEQRRQNQQQNRQNNGGSGNQGGGSAAPALSSGPVAGQTLAQGAGR
ncbi:FtsH protease activity modulator HflK [Aureimonas populi]|uniref:Protein HflK n=1 Tax=Aureimonas populi TaxID=1701758 RepID=A0ABW5CMV4_9HYPH|nr:FtsH protease activity modulator HflK [Aureimonas populi]